MLDNLRQFIRNLDSRQWALIGGVAAIGLIVAGVAGAALLAGGDDPEEQVQDPCAAESVDSEDCDDYNATARPGSASASASASGSPSVTPTPTKSPKPTATKAVVLPTKPPTAAPTAVPVTAPPPPPGPAPNAYVTLPYLSDNYLGAIGNVIEFAVMPGTPNTGIVASQNGGIYKVALDGSAPPTLWGDLSGKVTNSGAEQGLLSVAFSPGFATNGRVFAYYTAKNTSANTLSRYSASASGLNANPETILLNIPDFAANHNGGHIAFDNQGLLYLSTGDGGGGGDPQENGQNLTTLLGKVLRLDVSGNGYTIPGSNPFNDGGGPIREEIFAYGFRNPWRMTIDPQTNTPWLGDVGQGTWEEVDEVVIGGNYGWDCYEGNHSHEPAGCPVSGFRAPRQEYDHSFGQAVTGGAIYRGGSMPELYGWYVYGDFYSGRIWAVDAGGSGGSVQLTQVPYAIASFTMLPDGEILVVSYDSGVYRLTR